MAKRSLMYEFAYSVDRSANQMIPGNGAISQPNRNLAADYQSDIQWIGLRENLNRKPWFLPSNIDKYRGFRLIYFPIIQFYEVCRLCLCDFHKWLRLPPGTSNLLTSAGNWCQPWQIDFAVSLVSLGETPVTRLGLILWTFYTQTGSKNGEYPLVMSK